MTRTATPTQSRKPHPQTAKQLNATYQYRGAIAELLGFPRRRYSGTFERSVLERVHYALLGEHPGPKKTVPDIRAAIATEISLPEDSTHRFCKSGVVAIYEALQDLPADRLAAAQTLNECPVCDHPYHSITAHGDHISLASSTTRVTKDACITIKDDSLVEYVH